MPKVRKPFVQNALLLTDTASIQIGSPQWYDWLSTNKKFTFEDHGKRFTAQCEKRRNHVYWYAYRRRGGKLTKVYLGKSEELTHERLEKANALLEEQTFDGLLPAPTAIAAQAEGETRIDTSLLPAAKINAPVLPQKLVARQRLTRQINTPITLIYAPSGFGKSTLMNEWKQSCGFPVAWLSLDENDNHPQRFWYSVVTALQKVQVEFSKETLNDLNSAAPVHLSEIVLRLANDLAQFMENVPRLGLILDDFHRIHNTEIYDSLQAWLEHFPSSLQLVISGHIKPPLALGHLRAKGLVTELDANDLRFTLEEGIHYLRQYPQDPPVAYDDIEKLVKHAEGWAAGLTLTALALSKEGGRRQFIDSFNGAHIYLREYFMETVLQRSSPEVQTFLLKTAILKHLTGSLCNALTGQSNGDEMLARLWHENVFITRLEQQGWYRYHDLFAEMLYSQLQARAPEEVNLLHQRAAQWYREHYAPADAIYHLLATEAWEEAASLMEEMALRELAQYGEDSRLLGWLQELPESIVQKHKRLFFVYLRLASVALPQKKIERFVANIESNITSKPLALQTADEQDILIEIQQVRSAWAHGELFKLPPRAGNEYDAQWEVLNGVHLLSKIYDPDTETVERQVAALLQMAQTQGNLFVILMAGGVLARRAYINGQLRRAEKIAHQVLRQALAQRGKLPEPASIALTVLSQVHLERNEIELAQKYLAQAVETDPNPTSSNMLVQAATIRAKIQMAQCQLDEASLTLQSIRELHTRRPSGQWTQQDLLAYEALVCVRKGDYSAAEQLLGEEGAISEHPFSQWVQANVFLQEEQFELAEKLLRQLIVQYPTGIQFEPLMIARVPLALALFGQHKMNQARQVMAEAIRLAAPERFVRPFLDFGASCAPLLTLILKNENLTAEARLFIKDVLSLLGNANECPPLSQVQLDALSISASISAREQEVLHLISICCSNREIAERLSISESTVKTHLSNVYTKLGASGRLQAITRAKELNLL